MQFICSLSIEYLTKFKPLTVKNYLCIEIEINLKQQIALQSLNVLWRTKCPPPNDLKMNIIKKI